MARLKDAAATVRVPQSRDEVVEAIAELGRLTRERTLIETAMNEEVAVLRAHHHGKAAPIDAKMLKLLKGVLVYAEAHRDELTDGGKSKTAKLPSGEIKWRMAPPSVGVRGVDAVLERLRAAGLDRFIRCKEEISKEAILGDPDAVRGIDGITIKQIEEVVVEPYEASLERAA